jgi:tetratricopeptide (TPR) repeat protein
MSSSEPSQTLPHDPASAESSSIPLPPLPPAPAMEPAKFSRLCRGFDWTLDGVTLVFAFLIASFPVYNPDFFRQIAIGRMVANGDYAFGVDPFVYSGDNYYVNHSWLFGLMLYGLYQLPTIGGVAVVVFKALGIAVLAELMLRVGRPAGRSLWIPAACTTLAILVVSPRLYLQSTCLSYVFLALTLWLLTRERAGEKRLWWLLPPLFALWVNCDAWFVLGPLTVALYLAGELLQRALSDDYPASDAGQLGLVLLAGAAMCLLNPHHYHALTLPVEFGLTPAGDLIESDPQFLSLFLSPLRKEYYEPNLGYSVAGLAYWPLLFLGLVSFARTLGRVPWRRLSVWLGFALLSLYNIRAIPFFAIVGGPLMALNWLDYAATRRSEKPLTKAQRNWSLGGRVLTLLIGLALLLAVVPGWLQAKPQDYRRLGWSVRVDPSLKAMAETIRAWREGGLLPDEPPPHWFNLQYEIANYLAWFAPGERAFLDQALPNFRDTAEDYLALRQALEDVTNEPPSPDGEPLALERARRILRKHNVRYWIYDQTGGRKTVLFSPAWLFGSPQEWILCDLKGRIAVFAWRDPHPPQPTAPDPARAVALNLRRSAFGVDAERAPPSGPDIAPREHPWWQEWWRPQPPTTLDRETTLLDDILYQAEQAKRRHQEYIHGRSWQAAVAASALPLGIPNGPLPNNLLPLDWSWTYHELFPPNSIRLARAPRPSEQMAVQAWHAFTNTRPVESPAALYLALRAARRAVRDNPEDAASYFLLGQAYQRLREQRLEGDLLKTVPGFAEIRNAQLAAALQTFLRLTPDANETADAHEILYDLYGQMGYLDAAVHHLRRAVDKRSALGPRGVAPELHAQILEREAAELRKQEAELETRHQRYDVNAVSKTGLDKVQVAVELRLSDTAFAALEQFSQENQIDSLAPKEQAIVKQVTAMALHLGRLDKADELLLDRQKRGGQPVRPDYVDLYVCQAAARGDYEEADRLLDEALEQARQPAPRNVRDPRRATASSIVRVLLGEALKGTIRVPCSNPVLPSDFWMRRTRLDAIREGMRAGQLPARHHMTRGWLALEYGNNAEARQQFQIARAIAVSGDAWITEVNEVKAWFDAQNEIAELRQMGLLHAAMHDLSERYLKWFEQ